MWSAESFSDEGMDDVISQNQGAGDNRRGPLQFYDPGFPQFYFVAKSGLPADVSAFTLHGNPTMTRFGDISKDAVRFWELRRIIYNFVLLIIAVLTFTVAASGSQRWYSQPALRAFMHAALWANLLYCTAYGLELLFQFSRWREEWNRIRHLAFIVGLLLASALAGATACVIAFGSLDSH